MKMNRCGIQLFNQEETRSSSVSDDRDVVICPKPRRVGVLNHYLARSFRSQVSNQLDLCETNSRRESFDFFLSKSGGYEQDPVTSSPSQFFSGSPPNRVSNPLTKDSLFRDELLRVAPPLWTPRATNPPPSSSPKNGGSVRVTNFGSNRTVRVVGFDCLDRDKRRSNRSIPTLA